MEASPREKTSQKHSVHLGEGQLPATRRTLVLRPDGVDDALVAKQMSTDRRHQVSIMETNLQQYDEMLLQGSYG